MTICPEIQRYTILHVEFECVGYAKSLIAEVLK